MKPASGEPATSKNSKSSPLVNMVVFSATLASLAAYLFLSPTQAVPTSRREYTNDHGPSASLYNAMSNGDFTGDVTLCKGMPLELDLSIYSQSIYRLQREFCRHECDWRNPR